jgi:hypothetical protein
MINWLGRVGEPIEGESDFVFNMETVRLNCAALRVAYGRVERFRVPCMCVNVWVQLLEHVTSYIAMLPSLNASTSSFGAGQGVLVARRIDVACLYRVWARAITFVGLFC